MSVQYIISHSTWGVRLSAMDDQRKTPKATCFRVLLWLTGLLKNPYAHPLSEPNDFFYFQLKGYRIYRKHRLLT